MEKLTVSDFQRMIAEAAKNIEARSEEFSQLDAALGDGDHGEAITTAIKVIAAESTKGGDFKSLFNDMGFGVMMQTSGSTSTLLGGYLLGMGDGVPEGASELDAKQVAAMFKGGLEGVQKNTKAQVGDKTIMDSLVPAVMSMQEYEGNDVKAMMAGAAEAALAGVETTKAMVAKFGRARNLGEKVIGHVDAGATSWAEMFVSFSNAL
ncbi:MAG: DAK2 domain-containing protein [Rikenellaceae bacterium]